MQAADPKDNRSPSSLMTLKRGPHDLLEICASRKPVFTNVVVICVVSLPRMTDEETATEAVTLGSGLTGLSHANEAIVAPINTGSRVRSRVCVSSTARAGRSSLASLNHTGAAECHGMAVCLAPPNARSLAAAP